MFMKEVVPGGRVRTRRFARALLVGVAAHGVALGVLRAQNGCPTPGPLENIAGEHVADAMRSYASWHPRLNLDIPARDSAVTTPITDAAVCNAIYRGILKNIARMWKLPNGEDKGAALTGKNLRYYRLGNYYAAMLTPKPDGMVLNGWADLIIFERKTLRFIGVTRA